MLVGWKQKRRNFQFQTFPSFKYFCHIVNRAKKEKKEHKLLEKKYSYMIFNIVKSNQIILIIIITDKGRKLTIRYNYNYNYYW